MTDADLDTAQAVITAWQADPTLTKLFERPPTYGEVRKDPARDSKATLPFPYARLHVEKDRDAEHMTGMVYHDYRRVTITAAGPKAVADQAKLAILNVFNRKLGTLPNGPTLALPSGAAFRQWWPLNDGEIAKDPHAKDGQDIWIATIKGRVWSIRTV
jgi:hypothetical protein